MTFDEWMFNAFSQSFKNNDYDWGDMSECWNAAIEAAMDVVAKCHSDTGGGIHLEDPVDALKKLLTSH